MRKIIIFGIMLLFAVLASVLSFAGTSGPAPIPAPPNFQISTNVLSLCKGMINTIPVSIKTPAGAALMQSVQLSITNSKYAYTVGNGTVSAVNVTANKTNVVNMMIFTSLNSSSIISVGLAINYQYDSLYSDSEVRNVSFGVQSCPTPLTIGVSPGVLTSGKIENITFNLTNTGNTALNYISMHASLPSVDGTFLGAQPIQVRSIAPKGTVKVNENVFVYSNATQSFPINLTISLYNGTSLEQISQNPIVLSAGIVNITPSSITISPSQPSPGSIFSISFVLTDIGTAKASAVTATAIVPNGFIPYGSNSVFIGDMQVDSQTPATLTLTTQSTLKGGNYTIPVRINYLNNLRENLSTIINVPVQIASASTFNALVGGRLGGNTTAAQYRTRAGNGLVIIILLAIAVVVLLVLFFNERKHRRHLQSKSK